LILNEIYQALNKVDDHVYYGTALAHDKSLPWDYTVYSRNTLKRNQQKSGYATVFNVAIVREEYIPDGLEDEVVAAMEALAGVRMVEGEHEYFYSTKPNTSHVVEMVILKFTYSRKI